MQEVWLGNEEDDPGQQPDEEVDVDSGRVWPLIPAGVDFYDFVVRMGWADERVLDRQSVLWVYQHLQVYRFELETGILYPTI